jgi:hypothetical protein
MKSVNDLPLRVCLIALSALLCLMALIPLGALINNRLSEWRFNQAEYAGLAPANALLTRPIMRSNNQVTGIVSEITVATREQSQGFAQATGAIDNIDEMSTHNAQLVQKSKYGLVEAQCAPPASTGASAGARTGRDIHTIGIKAKNSKAEPRKMSSAARVKACWSIMRLI